MSRNTCQRMIVIASSAGKFSRRNWISAGLNERMRRFLHALPHRSNSRSLESSGPNFQHLRKRALGIGYAPYRHGIARSEGCSVAGEPADGGESAIIRGTSAPNPARMKAERAGPVYRVSHVVDGKLGILAGNAPRSLQFCRQVTRLSRLDPDFLDGMMIEAFL